MADNDLESADLENQGASLEDGVIDATGGNINGLVNPISDNPPPTTPLNSTNSKPKNLKEKLAKFNIYLILFGLVITLTVVIITIAYLQSQSQPSNVNSLKSQNLTQNSLDQLAANDSTLGVPKQDLNVEANTVFAGKVLISNGLQVAGGEEINGGLGLTSLTVRGTGKFQQIDSSGNLSVNGTTALQGSTSIGSSLQVNGNANFNGNVSSPQITTNQLQLNGDLNISHHLIVSGPNPTASTLSNVGSGGTTTVNGTDTAGNIIINTGTNPSAGCLVNISFSVPFQQTPYVIVSPVGPDSSNLEYYINRNSSSFSLCASATPPAQANISFDYLVIG